MAPPYPTSFIKLVILITIPAASSQTIRTFPRLFNTAQDKTVSTTPTGSTCGLIQRTAYCKSSIYEDSIRTCRQAFCEQECPRRTTLPTPTRLLDVSSGLGLCVTEDTINRRPGSTSNAVSFSSGFLCVLSLNNAPNVGDAGAFTLGFWVWMDSQNAGTIVEKYRTVNAEKEVIFSVQLTLSAVIFKYKTSQSLRQVSFAENFQLRRWTFITLQVYETIASLFVDGTDLNFAARVTQRLTLPLDDNIGVLRIGQDREGQNQFVGKLQDMTFFDETLANREIDLLYSGTLPSVRIQSSCPCPPNHPRVNPRKTHYCIRNTATDNIADEYMRLRNTAHPLAYLNDGDSNSVWISDFINDVIIDVDLGDQFNIFYIVLQFYSPSPKIVSIYRQTTTSTNWQLWQTYAEDCPTAFGKENNGALTTPNDVNCLQFGTLNLHVPLSKGNITFNLLSSEPIARPGHSDFYNTPSLIDFVKASKVRVRLQGHYYVTAPRHGYFGVYEFIVTGRCDCHGHAETCDTSELPYTCACEANSFTQGKKCDKCQPLYNDKPFKRGNQYEPYACKKCECYGHASSCIYDSSIDLFPDDHDRGGGGVCQQCQHHTTGRQCDSCEELYYRPEGRSLYAEVVCELCECFLAGIQGNSADCEKVGGNCSCKAFVTGRKCDECVTGYFNLQASNPAGCEACGCDVKGTIAGAITCDQTQGKCICKQNVRGRTCNTCEYGYYNLDENNLLGCTACQCNPLGSTSLYCDPDGGQCPCKTNTEGQFCNVCKDGYYGFESGCVQCGCNSAGTEPNSFCDKTTGQCECKKNVMGLKCDQCKDGFYDLDGGLIIGCKECSCNTAGTNPESFICDKLTGDCDCKENVMGRSCSQCKANTFNLSVSNEEGCSDCACDISGTLYGDQLAPNDLTCDQNTGECTCLANRIGIKCDSCDSGYYINSDPGGGCEPCDCYSRGTIKNTVCDVITGQCQCLQGDYGVSGRRCDSCEPKYWGQDNTGRCQQCDCDLSGSLNDTCNSATGQCVCKDFTEGRQCGRCIAGTSNLMADNPFGCSKDPSQQPPPSYTHISATSLLLEWSAPDYPNGVIQKYNVIRDTIVIAETGADELTYTDSGLLPFTLYIYQIEVFNDYGSAKSIPMSVRTLAGAPSGNMDIIVSSITSTSATLSWSRPSSANGNIQYYQLQSYNVYNTTAVIHYEGLATSVTVNDLNAYWKYTFFVESCTDGGCLGSERVNFTTRESVPVGQAPPDITPLTSRSLYIKWSPPEEPNGVILFYELHMRGTVNEDGIREMAPRQIFYTSGQYDPLEEFETEKPILDPPQTNFTVTNLQPFTTYEFQVVSQNSLGKAASPWITGRTLEDIPLIMNMPIISAVSSTAINVTWEAPFEIGEARGEIVKYIVYHLVYNDLVLEPFAPPTIWMTVVEVSGNDTFYVVEGFPPYTNQTFKVGACNSVGCVNSTLASGPTDIAAPSGMAAPLVSAHNMSSLSITWDSPAEPNGPDPYYIVRRTESSFNFPPPAVEPGVRFSGTGYIKFAANTIPQGVAFTGIELWFRTNQEDGLLFFAASEGAQEEFIALQLQASRPWFLYDPQGCMAGVTIEDYEVYNMSDSEWHYFRARRSGKAATITIDEDNGCVINISPNGDEGKSYQGTWHHMSVRRTGNHASIIMDSQFRGCASIVTTTDDEGLPYNDNEWHLMRARRRSKSGAIFLDNSWKGCTTFVSVSQEGISYADDRWHKLVIRRRYIKTIVSVDDLSGEKVAECATGTIIGENTGVYIGGIPDDYILQRQEADSRAQVTDRNFMGCIRDIRILVQETPEEVWVPLDWDANEEVGGMSSIDAGCPTDLERSYHFLGTGYASYIPDAFTGKEPISVIFHIRTEYTSGLLFFAYGAHGTYYLIQLVAGGIYVELSGPEGRESLVFPNNTIINICDGDWHLIRIDKRGRRLTIQLDYIEKREGLADSSEPLSLAITSELYLGGLPPDEEVQSYIKENKLNSYIQGSYGGCMKELSISRRSYDLAKNYIKLVNVNMDGCPTGTSLRTCIPRESSIIYNGTDHSTANYELQSFTEYMYSVQAVNSAGNSMSPWTIRRTKEGAPFGVSGPQKVKVLSGYRISAQWSTPSGHSGQLTEFILRARNTANISEFVEAVFKPDVFSGEITNAHPYTNYTVSFVACTVGGCTESTDNVQVMTSEEAPQGVYPPTAYERGGHYIIIQWLPPEFTNGILTGYLLYVENTLIYDGGETMFNLTDLNVYTGYRVYVKACTRKDCTPSSEVVLMTAELPPSYVAPPELTVLDTRRMEVKWTKPRQINGDLQRYLIYVSVLEDDLGDVRYNETDQFEDYTFIDLTPGTLYFICVAACTGGGCRISMPSNATTEESSPEGVYAPIVVSPSPSELNVTWTEPEYPNGIIIEYKLYHNGLQVMNSTTIANKFIDGLQPWSLHKFHLAACTARGCGRSEEISARTQESQPLGEVGLEIGEVKSRSVLVRYTGVAVPNGVVYYDIYFDGPFYIDADNWNFNTVTDRRSLFTSNATPPIDPEFVLINDLVPFSSYSIQVNASNSAGFLVSHVEDVDTKAGEPDGVRAPVLTSPTSSSIRAVWQGVERLNSEQEPTYQLQFKELPEDAKIENMFPQTTTSMTFLKTGLQPYTSYQFRVIAENPFGQALSEWSTLITKQDKPTGLDPPMAKDVGARTLTLKWIAPLKPNGIITTYRIYSQDNLKAVVNANQTEWTLENLVPSSTHTFRIEACTIAGCTTSAQSAQITLKSAEPEGIASPSVSSTSPTSVIITWTDPQYPNGAISQFGIQRRKLNDDTNIVLVRTFLPNDPKEYLDQSAVIEPATSYEYRIMVQNSAGKGYGPWAVVTTRSSRPGGVQPPTVNVLTSTSMQITWLPPIRPNGKLEMYIVKLPVPRIEISNVSIQSIIIQDLSSFTEYSVTLTACSDGGCTESSPVVIVTSPSVPQGQSPPIPIPHSQTFISVTWPAPTQPNGPNIRYELSRLKIRQPLEGTSDGFGHWTSIFVGTDRYYEDKALSIFTTYQYRVTVYNDYGHTTSLASEEVTTFGGTPTRPPIVTTRVEDHTTIEILWTTPTTEELQGKVNQFIVNVTNPATDEMVSFTEDPDVNDIKVGNLLPNTLYEVTVTIVTHGGSEITSQASFITTRDGAPTGLEPPYLIVLNQTAFRVAWTAPSNPNGQVTSYILHRDGIAMNLNTNQPGSIEMADLEPYRVYIFQIEVCTVYGCVTSDPVQGTTAESVASGIIAPTLTVESSASMTVIWSAPNNPNGIILRYELYRRDLLPCSDSVDPNEGSDGKCRYFECGILESFCGDQCYSGPKTCCDGTIYDNKRDYECCGSAYIPKRAQTDYICCGGIFHRPLSNYQCCGQRYVAVNEGEICCPDAYEDRVSVGPGNACCSSIPYSTNGAQVCCDGELVDGFKKQCCGGKIVSDAYKCCGNSTMGGYYSPSESMSCCGAEYVETAVSSCCVDQQGYSKAHLYETSDAKSKANEKCCGIERISAGLDCCNGVGYNGATQTCADISDMESGCGSGVVCPKANAASAFCDQCGFNQATTKCGSYVPQITHRSYITTESTSDLCLTEPMKVYQGKLTSYSDSDLRPYTEYQYFVVVVNGAGSASSKSSTAVTAEAQPAGLDSLKADVEEDQLDTIYLSWQQPDEPNGIILWYMLLRDGVEIFRHPTQMQYTDENAIQPYQTYRYKLKACNSVGCVENPEIEVATLQSRPEQFSPPSITVETSTSVTLMWDTPSKPNGYIIEYIIYEENIGVVINVTGSARQYTTQSLSPYTEYSFWIAACTEAGCTNSSAKTVRTSSDKPLGFRRPYLIVTSSTSAEISWESPIEPNGVIVGYKIHRSTNDGEFIQIAQVLDTVHHYIDNGVLPNIRYTYKIEAYNVAGSVISPAITVTMPTSTPSGISAPTNVSVLSPYSIYVQWIEPSQPNGQIDSFKILLNAGTSEQQEKSVGLAFDGIFTGLLPYTLYTVRIQACLDGIPNGCGVGPGVTATTHEAPPEGQQPAELVALTSSSVMVMWEPPTSPNGVITQYRVHRRNSGSTGQGNVINVVSGEVRTITNTAAELQPYTLYEYMVTAVNSQGSTASNWAEVRTLAAAPQVLNPPLVKLISAYSLTISWGPPISPNGVISEYRLEYEVVSNDPTISTPTYSVSVSGDSLETSISGLQPYTAHRLRVVAINSAGSLTSQWRLTTTAQASPSGVGPFTVEKVTDGQSVILRWSEPAYSNGIVKAYLVYEEDNVNPVYQGLTREFEYRRLQPYTQYKIQLEACTDGGCTKSSLQAFFTAEVNPSDQPAPSTGSVNATHATLTWTKPINSNGEILRYDVLRRNNGRITKRDTSPDGQIVYSTTDTDADSFTYTDSGLDPYTHYQYAIQATNAVGSTQSSWQSVETKQAPPSGVSPPIVSHIAESSEKLLIRWTAPTRANGIIRDYQLQRNDTIPLRFAPTDLKTYTDSGLTAHTVYTYTLTVCSGGGCTTSLPTVIQTSETAPFYVASPTVNTIDSTSISVSWDEPQVTNGRIQVYHLQVDGTTIYSGQNLEYLVTNLVPYQAYAFSIQACTYGGCTESSSVVGRPLAASPTNLARPNLRVTGSSSIEISWSPPSNPNGVITAYEVYRGDELITTTTTRLLFTDYDVEPGKTYSYKIIAYNSQGSVESPANAATTYASAPAGLAAPSLEALSSNSVRASWSEPTHPNGVIHNYTLYKNSDDIVYSERGLTTIVRQLKPWTTFSFRVEACTTNGCTLSESSSIRTLEAPPEGMAIPTLTAIANAFGAMESVFVQWTAPLSPNGIIIKYELYRREYTGSRDDVPGITGKLLFSGIDLTYTDQDPELKPYTYYEYKILSANSEGSVQSQWGSVLTKEAPPEGVPAPTIEYTTANAIRLNIQEPEQPNGYITRYNVYLNGTLVEAGTATKVDIETLSPYSVYIIYVEACTAGGCTTGVSVATTTQGAIPDGMGPLQVTNIARESFDVKWSQPSTPNGVIIRYEVHMRQSCPHPYADDDDEVTMPCEEGAWKEVANDLVNQVTIGNLMPYTRYECKVNAINEVGGLQSPSVVSAVTLSAPPVYITSNPPKLQPTGNIVEVNWGHCFRINGEVNQFVLFQDGQIEYTGLATTYNVYRNSRYEVYEFKVTLYTDQGEAETPTLIFDPSKPDYVAIVGTSEATTFGPTTEAVRAATLPVYQEVWFIVVVAILALVLLFIGIALCLRCSGHRMPYIRERAPLQPRQRKVVEGMPYFDGNFISSEIPPQSQYAPSMHSAGVGALPHVGYVNPAYSHLAVPLSQSASMVDLHIDKVSQKSIPWEDDEDVWDGPIAYGGTDSGLHSLAYGDDYDAASDQPISVLKEHTMFSDTHL